MVNLWNFENGIIAFHDVLDSEWQRQQNSHVDRVWREIKPWFEYKEFIAPLSQSIEKWPQTAPHGFGGIGVVTMNHEKFKKLK